MKSVIIFLFYFLSMGTFSYSQEKDLYNSGSANLKAVEMPEIILKSAGKDFSVYIPDINPDINVRKIEEKFQAFDLGKDYEGYDSYLVILKSNIGTLAATYNEKGILTRVVEKYIDVKLPTPVIFSVYQKYPDWKIVREKYLYTQKEGVVNQREYKIIIEKDNKTKKLIVYPDGYIANSD